METDLLRQLASSRTATVSPVRPLHMGIMLRAVDEVDGAGVYIRKLITALLDRDRVNRYTLFYRSPAQRGRFGPRPNVQEVVVPAPSKLAWDQLAMPLAAMRARVDVLFHHKFSIPLLAPCPTVVQQRSSEYWTYPQHFDLPDRLYNRLMLPIFCRRATRVLTNSDALADELHKHAGIARHRMRTVHAAADARYHPVTDSRHLAAVRARYALPERPYFLMVAKGYARLGRADCALYPMKNIAGTIRAHARVRALLPAAPTLVIVGSGIRERLDSADVDEGVGAVSVHVPGLVEHDDMPALYSMAAALVFPSLQESFGIPLVEAMACGCPVITSNAGACPEVVGDAGVIVDPTDVDAIAGAMARVASDETFAASLRAMGLARAAQFSWARSAERLLEELTAAAAS